MAQLTEFGRDVKKKLIDLDKSQVWLMEQITDKTGLYCDHGYLNKIFTGQNSAPKITTAIREVLGMD